MATRHGKLVLTTRVEDDTRCVVLDVGEDEPGNAELSVEVWDETDEDSDVPLWEDSYSVEDLSVGTLKSDLVKQGVSEETATEAVRTVDVLFDYLGKIQEAFRPTA